MANVQKIIADIYAIDNYNDLNSIVEAIKLKRTHLAKSMARSFSKGDLVQFRSKTGTVKGSVVKVNIKYVIVDAAIGGTRYKVPASMLETV
jgi:hypothetical protein